MIRVLIGCWKCLTKGAEYRQRSALLHELKNIVLDFIKAIERMNFTDNDDIKQLYDKARDIETQLINVDYIGKPSNISRLVEVTDKLDKKKSICGSCQNAKVQSGIHGVLCRFR